jgi:NitT/TauT family transport system substrate-binding protein
MKWVVAHPDEAVDMVAKVDPLIDKKLERQRLGMAVEVNILTPYVQANGIGGVDPARLESSIRQIAGALNLKSTPAASDIWTAAYLPPPEQRKLAP